MEPSTTNGDPPERPDLLGLEPYRAPAEPAAPPRRNRRWVWFFAALAVFAVLAIGINLAWNLGEPVTPEQVQAARTKWVMSRPPDYDLHIVAVQANGSIKNIYDVRVRGGRVVEFKVNGRDPEPLQSRAEERRQREMYDIDGLFDAVTDLMEQDRRAGRKAFTRARFDKADGHLLLFQRQYQGRREQHIQVEMTRVPPEAQP